MINKDTVYSSKDIESRDLELDNENWNKLCRNEVSYRQINIDDYINKDYRKVESQ